MATGETAEQRQVEPQGEDERQRREEKWLLHTCPLLPSSRPLGPSAMQCSPTHGPQSPAQPSAPREWPARRRGSSADRGPSLRLDYFF